MNDLPMMKLVAPGRLERPSPTLQVGVLPVGRQGHGCCARIRTAIRGFKVRRPTFGRRSSLVAGGGIEPPTSGFRDRRSATELTRIVWGDRWESNPCFRSHKPASWPLDDGPHELVGSAGLEPAASATPRQRSARLSYDPLWSEWADSNRRPRGPKPRALPTELHPGVV